MNPARLQLNISQRKELLVKIEQDIQHLTGIFKRLKREEPKIRQRTGQYATPSLRLKAERLLRELPGQITELTKQIMALEEEIS